MFCFFSLVLESSLTATFPVTVEAQKTVIFKKEILVAGQCILAGFWYPRSGHGRTITWLFLTMNHEGVFKVEQRVRQKELHTA